MNPVTDSLVAVAGRAVTLPMVRPSIASNRHFQSPPVPARLCVSRGAGFFCGGDSLFFLPIRVQESRGKK